jgi:hypothetical protein
MTEPAGPSDDTLKVVDDYVSAELAVGWAKKSSLETRALAIVTVNTVIATLYIAIRAQFITTATSLPQISQILLLVGLGVSIVSLGTAVAAVAPTRYEQPTSDVFDTLFERATDPTYEFVRAEVIESRIKQYSDVTSQNKRKAVLVTIAFSCLAGLALSLIASVLLASILRVN